MEQFYLSVRNKDPGPYVLLEQQSFSFYLLDRALEVVRWAEGWLREAKHSVSLTHLTFHPPFHAAQPLVWSLLARFQLMPGKASLAAGSSFSPGSFEV